jgi:hypothetical protein
MGVDKLCSCHRAYSGRFDFGACIHLGAGHDDQGSGCAGGRSCSHLASLGETSASGTLFEAVLPACHAVHATDRQSFGNIVVVALIIALVPRYFPRWLCGCALRAGVTRPRRKRAWESLETLAALVQASWWDSILILRGQSHGVRIGREERLPDPCQPCRTAVIRQL